jgi:hypothetical protein
VTSRGQESTGVLVVRIWVEGSGNWGLRARITSTFDISRGVEETTTVAETKAVLDAVQVWLAEFVADVGRRSSQVTEQ